MQIGATPEAQFPPVDPLPAAGSSVTFGSLTFGTKFYIIYVAYDERRFKKVGSFLHNGEWVNAKREGELRHEEDRYVHINDDSIVHTS